MEATRSDKQFCSPRCRMRARRGWTPERSCRYCGQTFTIGQVKGDANRQHCSKECAKKHNSKALSTWHAEHPDAMDGYNATRLAKNPGAWREKHRAERQRIIAMLGGRCLVCEVINPFWLHVDYVPGSRTLKYRHPRHPRFVRDHLSDFRLLCANHHYELTLTGRIEGTDITQ